MIAALDRSSDVATGSKHGGEIGRERGYLMGSLANSFAKPAEIVTSMVKRYAPSQSLGVGQQKGVRLGDQRVRGANAEASDFKRRSDARTSFVRRRCVQRSLAESVTSPRLSSSS